MFLTIPFLVLFRIYMLCNKNLPLNSLFFWWYKPKIKKLNDGTQSSLYEDISIISLLNNNKNQRNEYGDDGTENAFFSCFQNASPEDQKEILSHLNRTRKANLHPWCLCYVNIWLLNGVLVADFVISCIILVIMCLGSRQTAVSSSSVPNFSSTEIDLSVQENTIRQIIPTEKNDVEPIVSFIEKQTEEEIRKEEKAEQDAKQTKSTTTKSIPPTFEPRILSCPAVNTYKRNISKDDCRILRKPLGDKMHGYQLKFSSCENASTSIDHIELSIYRFSVFDSFAVSLEKNIPMIKTIVIYGGEILDYGEIENVPSSAFQLHWPAVENITIYDVLDCVDCPKILKAVESWRMPKLKSIQVENSLLLKGNTLQINKIFKKYSQNITTLILQNVSLCEACEIFNGDFNFTPMYKTILNYNNPSKPLVIRQTERFIWIAPYLRDFETNAQFSHIQIGRLPQILPCLQRVEFAVVLDLDLSENIHSFHVRDRNLNLSVNCITQFPNLTHATLNVKVKDSSLVSKYHLDQFNIVVQDVESLAKHENLKNVTINSCSGIPFKYVKNARKICDKTISHTEEAWGCVRN